MIAITNDRFDLAKTRMELAALQHREAWQRLQAVRTGQVYITDGNQFFNRPGPRLVESLEILAAIIHPAIFNARHEIFGGGAVAQSA